MKTLALIAVRDEERFLPGYFAHLRNFVDGFAVVDDGSVDATWSLIQKEPKLSFSFRREVRAADHFFEIENRELLLNAAKDLGAEWVLGCDADERYEMAFLKNMAALQNEAEKREKRAIALQVFGLWNSPVTYRADTPIGRLSKFVLFKVPTEISYADRPKRALHSSWLPVAMMNPAYHWSTDYRIYHLRSVHPADRIRRFEKFRRIDPENKWQPVGYDHLVSEVGIELKTIEPGREFDLLSLPPDMMIK